MAISFCKISSPEPVIAYLAITISRRLATGEKVLWLVAGGSSIPIATEVSRRLGSADLKNLTVSLTDERYGPIGHPDSNWRQLEEAGFSLSDAQTQPILMGVALRKTAAHYAELLRADLALADYSLGFIGVGADGHVAGIKPHSPATSSRQMATAYESEDFVRLTITPIGIAQLDEVVTYAAGEAKWALLNQLEKNLPISQQPAQCLKSAGKLTIYNDYKGDDV